jgi:hypothetical protein
VQVQPDHLDEPSPPAAGQWRTGTTPPAKAAPCIPARPGQRSRPRPSDACPAAGWTVRHPVLPRRRPQHGRHDPPVIKMPRPRPDRASSSNPARTRAAYRPRQPITVGLDTRPAPRSGYSSSPPRPAARSAPAPPTPPAQRTSASAGTDRTDAIGWQHEPCWGIPPDRPLRNPVSATIGSRVSRRGLP